MGLADSFPPTVLDRLMRVILEVKSGPSAGKRIPLQSGQVAQFGRTEWADFSFPQDSEMSDVHFALECHRDRCVVCDLNSASGTRLNDQSVTRANCRNGDQIRAGQTTFTVFCQGATNELEDAGGAAPESTLR